jgi:DNA polymerase-3 subunit gamma/tau
MSYVVLARKWRPQTFADLTGQAHVARTLTNALLQDRVPHAILFTGARGVGKTSSARILAMALNCAGGPTPSPCGVCDACAEIQRGACTDVLEIDGASNRGINEIRELRDSVRYAPQRDRRKVYIIDEVHMLTTEAFNALLKTLEEPPPHVVFVLATTEVHKIPNTILSRCQRFDFRRIAHADIVERLGHIVAAEGMPIHRDVLSLIARQAQGGMRDALSLLDQIIAFAGADASVEQVSGILGAVSRSRLFELSDALLRRDAGAALQTLDRICDHGVHLGTLAADLLEHLRDLTVVASTDGLAGHALSTDEVVVARQQVARTDAASLHRMFEIGVELAETVSRSGHGRLVLEMGLLRMASLAPMLAIDDLIARLEALAAGTSLPSAPPGFGTVHGQGGVPHRPATTLPPPVPCADTLPPPAALAHVPSEPEAPRPAPSLPAPESAVEPRPQMDVEPVPALAAEPAPEMASAPGPPVAAEPAPEMAAEPAPEMAAEPAPQPEPRHAAEARVDRSDPPAPATVPVEAVGPEWAEDGVPERATEAVPEAVVQAWESVLETWAEESAPSAALFALATLHVLPSGAMRVTMGPQMWDRLTERLQNALQERMEQALGRPLRWRWHPHGEVSAGEQGLGHCREEARQRRAAAREEALRHFVATHPMVARIHHHFPDARVIRIIPHTTAEEDA